MDLQDLLSAKVDIVTDKGLNKHIREKVLKEAPSKVLASDGYRMKKGKLVRLTM